MTRWSRCGFGLLPVLVALVFLVLATTPASLGAEEAGGTGESPMLSATPVVTTGNAVPQQSGDSASESCPGDQCDRTDEPVAPTTLRVRTATSSYTWPIGDQLQISVTPPQGVDGKPAGIIYDYSVQIYNNGGRMTGLSVVSASDPENPKEIMTLASYGTAGVGLSGTISTADVAAGSITIPAPGITILNSGGQVIGTTGAFSFPYEPPAPPVVKVDLDAVPTWTQAGCEGAVVEPPTITLPVDEQDLVTFTVDPPGTHGEWLPGQEVLVTATLPANHEFGEVAEGWTVDSGNLALATFPIQLYDIQCAFPDVSLVIAIDDPQPAYGAGDIIPYTVTVTNAGNVPLTGITVTLPLVDDLVCNGTEVALDHDISCTANYVVTQPDVDAGHAIIARASVSGIAPDGQTTVTDAMSIPVSVDVHAPAISLRTGHDRKQIDAADQTVSYTFVVSNTGNVTLGSIRVNDDVLAAAGIDILCPSGSLAPEAEMVCTATLTTNQDMLDAGSAIVTSSTATGIASGGSDVTSPSSGATIPVIQRAGFDLDYAAVRVWSLDGTSRDIAPGEIVTDIEAADSVLFQLTVRNDGNVTLESVSAMSSMPGMFECTPSTTELAPGESITCTALYQITGDNYRNGGYTSNAHIRGTSPGGMPIDADAQVRVYAHEAPSLALARTAIVVNGTPVTGQVIDLAAGDEVTATFLVTNDGNVPLSDVRLDDPLAGPDGISCSQPVTLAPQEALTCDVTWIVAQDAVDRGEMVSTTTASATTDDGMVLTQSETLMARTVAAEPGLVLAVTADPETANRVGAIITWSLVVTNTGNVTISDLVLQDRMPTTGTITCPETTIVPGTSLTCTASTTITQAQLDAGDVVLSEVTAMGRGPQRTESGFRMMASGPERDVTSGPVSATVRIIQEPGLEVVLHASVPTDEAIVPGTVVTWTFTVTNTGNTTLQGVLIESEVEQAPVKNRPPAIGTLAPGQSRTGTGTSVLTAANIADGFVRSVAVATNGAVHSSGVTLTLPFDVVAVPTPTPDIPDVTPSPSSPVTPEPANPEITTPVPTSTPAQDAPSPASTPGTTRPAGEVDPAATPSSLTTGSLQVNAPSTDAPEITGLPATGKASAAPETLSWIAAGLGALVFASAAFAIRRRDHR